MRDPGKVHQLPRADFAAEMVLEPGLVIGFNTPGGEELSGTILAFDDAMVEVDFNHPLAGRVVIFDVEIIDVVQAESDD